MSRSIARDSPSLPWRFYDDPYQSHPLHRDATNDWLDANCYTDLWIELVHGLGLDPMPMLAFTLGIDFEGDQWTFFKPPIEDLGRLYNIDLVELAIYQSLDCHVETQLRMGRIPVLEVDAHFLPDVPDTYRRQHSKTTIAVVGIDRSAGVARYLHNAGCFWLAPADYVGVFRTDHRAQEVTQLPPYVETAKVGNAHRLEPPDLVADALDNAGRYLARRGGPTAMEGFLDCFVSDVTRIAAEDPGGFDGYAFGTLRQLGAASALSARFARWLAHAARLDGLHDAAESLDVVSQCAKRLILKAARAAATGRSIVSEETFAEVSQAWPRAADQFKRALPRRAA